MLVMSMFIETVYACCVRTFAPQGNLTLLHVCGTTFIPCLWNIKIAVCIANITDLMIHFYSFSDLSLCTVDPILTHSHIDTSFFILTSEFATCRHLRRGGGGGHRNL